MRKALSKDRISAVVTSLAAATPDALWFVGLALVAFGIGLIYLPAGVIAAGFGACFVGYAAGDSS